MKILRYLLKHDDGYKNSIRILKWKALILQLKGQE